MKAVGRIGSYITKSVYTVSGPFHPFGGAVDIIVVQQKDGSFKSSPWYVRFGKFQGVLQAKQKVVSISVNAVEADFNMYLDHKGEAYFLREVDFEDGDGLSSPSSSGEDIDGQSHDRRPLKSKSCEYDACESSSLTQIDLSNGNVVATTSSQRSRILGLVFGRKSVKKDGLPVEQNDAGVNRSESLERAEIAADLLEVKWSTNLVSPRHRKDNTSRLSSQQKLEASDVEDLMVKDGQNDVDSRISDNIIDHSGNCILHGGGPDQVYVETSQTTGLVCQLNSQAETEFNAKEHSSSGEILENKNDVVSPLGGSTTENALISSSSIENGFVTETYAETVTLQPVCGCAQAFESRSIVTISSLSNSTCEALVEETLCVEDNKRECEPPARPAGGPIQLNILTSEILEEEHLLFGGFDDLKFNAVRDTEELTSPEDDVKDGDHQQFITEPETEFRRKLKPVSSHADIPASGGTHSETAFRGSRSLPNMSAHNYKLCEHDLDQYLDQPNDSDSKSLSKDDFLSTITQDADTENQQSKSGPTAEDAGTVDELKYGLNKPAADTAFSNTDTEDEKGLPKLKVGKRKTRFIIPTSEQLASLNLKDGRNSVVFTFSTPMLGTQQVDAQIYLWKWDARVVISDVDGTITRSDLLGQVMPWVGVDWSQSGVAHLFSAIKENGYQLLFLSARAISQAYHTRQFLINLKQDGKVLPEGPVVISPDGLFPSLYREVVRRAPHEFKIACLEVIKALFPSDRNPFYAGFGNRDTDEISYLKVGIPRGKIFIINPKGEIVVNRRVDTRTYTSLHTLVHDMFPPMSTSEQIEDFNSWNYWKLPPTEI